MRMRWAAVWAMALALCACGPKLDGLEKGEKGRAAEVRDGDTLVMGDGLVVHLAGVEAPRGDQPRAKESRAALERLTAHRAVQLAYGPGAPHRLRDAAVAQAFAQSEGGRWIWVQQALLLSGDVRVHTRKDNVARLDQLRAAEEAARKAKRGLWADPAYAIRTAEQMARSDEDASADPACIAERVALEAARAARKDAAKATPAAPAGAQAIAASGAEAADASAATQGEAPRRPRRARDFVIVEGRVSNVAERERAVFLNFGDDIDRDFGVLIPLDTVSAWPGGVDAIRQLEGDHVRVRGEVNHCGKPLMRVDHVQQLEALGD